MRIVVEILSDGRFRVWKEDRHTMPLEDDELVKHLKKMPTGEEYYKMRTVDEWHTHHLKELDQRDRY